MTSLSRDIHSDREKDIITKFNLNVIDVLQRIYSKDQSVNVELFLLLVPKKNWKSNRKVFYSSKEMWITEM